MKEEELRKRLKEEIREYKKKEEEKTLQRMKKF